MNSTRLLSTAALLAGLVIGIAAAVAPTRATATAAQAAPAPGSAAATSSHTIRFPLIFADSSAAANAVRPTNTAIYSGVSLEGVPWDMNKLTAWERNVAGQTMSIVGYWSFWSVGGASQAFDPVGFDKIRAHGSIPLITWAPEDANAGNVQPDYQLADIISGRYDAFLKTWAQQAKAWGHPFFLRFAHEPDGNWFPWGEDANGNQRGQYVQAWRHVHDLFAAAGANNATWVWCPNVQWQGSHRPTYASLYPGDAYVDWTCIDAYNWGADYPTNGGFESFDHIFRYAYDTLMQVAPSKPVMLGEWASAEKGGSKAAWIMDALSVQIPYNYPSIKAEVWYNWVMSGVDWRVESSAASATAWRYALVAPHWRAAEYRNLQASPIPPPK